MDTYRAANSVGYTYSCRPDLPKETRTFVLERDGFACKMCGAVSGEPHHYDEGQMARIRVGRILTKSMGGGGDATNLRAICSVCEDGLRNLRLNRPSLKDLLIQIRRATGSDQLEVLTWLITKYPVQGAQILAEREK